MEIIIPSSLIGSPNDRVILFPMEKLRARYLGNRVDSYISLDFDLYSAQRGANPGWANRLEGADIYATLLVNSSVERTDADGLMKDAPRIEEGLSQLPDKDLADVELARVDKPLRQMFGAIFRYNFGLAKATKLLCLKRPRLIPMMDRYVTLALKFKNANAQSAEAVDRAIDALALFQELVRFQKAATLKALCDNLTKDVAAHLLKQGISKPHPRFSAVRVMDNLLWFDEVGYKTKAYTSQWKKTKNGIAPR